MSPISPVSVSLLTFSFLHVAPTHIQSTVVYYSSRSFDAYYCISPGAAIKRGLFSDSQKLHTSASDLPSFGKARTGQLLSRVGHATLGRSRHRPRAQEKKRPASTRARSRTFIACTAWAQGGWSGATAVRPATPSVWDMTHFGKKKKSHRFLTCHTSPTPVGTSSGRNPVAVPSFTYTRYEAREHTHLAQ
jgi:hypothetical protein